MSNMTTGKRIAIYLGFTFAVTYALEIFVIGNLMNNAALAPVFTLLVGAMMFIPALGVLFTRLVTKEGFKDAWILPNFKGHVRFYILAWLLPAGLIIIGAALYFIIYPNLFDPAMGYMAQSYAAQGLSLESPAVQSMTLLSIAVGLLFSPVLNILNATGEEWGWRGYLVPKLSEKMSVVPTVLLSGVIWGLWHAPLTILIGHNYGFGYAGYPFTGILAMCGFCIVMGTLFSYVSLRTRSCLPAAIAHGTLNGMAATGVVFISGVDAVNPFVGPVPTGIIGGIGFIVAMVILIVIMVRLEKKQQLIAPPKQAAVEPDALPASAE